MSSASPWFAPDPGRIRPEDFAGRFSMFDDGWTGRLVLRHEQGRALSGTFWSYRFEDVFRVTADVDAAEPHRIEFVIHNFNWMERQTYSGWLLTQSRDALAGTSVWTN